MVFSGEILLCIDARIKVRSLVTGNTIHYPLSLREGIDIFSPSEFIEYYRKHVTVHRVAKSDALQTT
jgi:capsule polysaccharide export protein KpsE/RkpR